MTIASALAFIRRTREDPELAAKIERLGPEATLDQLVALGSEIGLAFDVEALRAAHKHDYAFRSARYSRDDR